MNIHEVEQGSQEWLALRFTKHGASEAAAMLGLSPHMKRNELIKIKATGIPKEFSDFVQTRVLDKGHEVEALARPLAEKILGEDLYPITCSDGDLIASCDGATMAADTLKVWENKQWNQALADHIAATGEVPESHMPQCQQILMVTGAEILLFTCTDGTEKNLEQAWVLPDTAWFARLRAGWDQFDLDVAAYTGGIEHVEVKAAKKLNDLPALVIRATGAVSESNFPAFRDAALARIRATNMVLETDEDFAVAAQEVGYFERAEKQLRMVIEQTISQAAPIQEVVAGVESIIAEMKVKRLELGKAVDAEKLRKKGAIAKAAQAALDAHYATLNAGLSKPWLTVASEDWGGSMKGLKTLDSCQNACDTALAHLKIEANAVAERYRANAKHVDEKLGGMWALFPDFSRVGLQALETFAPFADARKNAHDAQEKAKREREEAARAAPVVVPAPAAAPAPAARPVSGGVRSAAPRALPPISTTEICERLGLTLTVDRLKALGFDEAPRPEGKRSGAFWHAAQFPRMCAKLSDEILSIGTKYLG